MRRALLILLLLVALAVLIGLAVVEDPGYVLIAYKNFRYESSLWAAVTVIAVLALAVYLVRLLLSLVLVSGGVVNPWSRRNRQRRVQLASEQGLLDLAEGRWARAVRHLQRAADGERQPLIYYLGAARAANELGEYEQSDGFLEKALERQPHAELAIALAHAELQQARGQTEAALETLQVMRDRHPHHRQVLKHLQQVHQQRGDWPAVIALLPDLRKDKVLGDAELTALEQQAWSARLASAANDGLNDGEIALQPLTQAWQHLSKSQRGEPQLVAVYAEQLRVLGAPEEAEEVLRAAIARQYDSRLVELYGLVRGRDVAKQLQTAEGWLKANPTDPVLLLCLGRLCLQNHLWGKAREYFESSLSFARHPQACAELARLLAQLGEVQRSNELFQEGLSLLDQRLPNLPLPKTVSA
ncbi:heme biosynthesis HemY N-terminal domain-containing protein [Pseudomonas turukhanskensis]|uniref:Heme biosynthesis protein HemY n=1 Tax=Pseudomonas turukhanskensis TaxID=1806536 RepID=A0A9W6K146_9PSED|nr:heme biosynthesis HemY N-terminal domain-containing protein [Pseudomonas turukhanskensis]GLK87571.1 heme biosynthesis protein HemY [Pseudomonas turukhanskensis]